jgi:hypothetical protein
LLSVNDPVSLRAFGVNSDVAVIASYSSRVSAR